MPTPTGRFPAHVIAVIPTADRSKGTVTVRIALDQKDARILPEMGVRVSFLAGSPRSGGQPGAHRPPASALPAERGAGDRIRPARCSSCTTTRVERRAVRLGAGSGDSVTVLSGLTAGERVAVGDFARLKDGAKDSHRTMNAASGGSGS